MLEGVNLGRRGRDGEWLLRGIDLELAAGEHLGVVGESGAGKTLLLRALARLDPLAEGEVRLDGEVPRDDRLPAFRHRVIYLHQRAPLFDGTVEENLRRPLALASAAGHTFERQRLLDWLERLGRGADFLAKQRRDLSGGEAQITALLRALQLDPKVLLLDEPTAALDASTRSAAEGLLADWLTEPSERRAAVWVTHDHDQLARVAQRTVHLQSGRLAESSRDGAAGS
jgi:putative ABC transport system ATP-binding protein